MASAGRTRHDVRKHNTRHEVRITSTLICTGYCGHWCTRIPVPEVLCHSLTELKEVPGKGMGFLQSSRSSGCWYGSFTELPEVPGIVARAFRTHRSSERYKKAVPRTPSTVATGVQNSRSSGYGHECRTELPEVPGTGMNVLHNLQKLFVG